MNNVIEIFEVTFLVVEAKPCEEEKHCSWYLNSRCI